MDAFVVKHANAIRGVLSCCDRVLFRGYVPRMSGSAMAEFLTLKHVDRWTLEAFLLAQAERIKQHALAMAAETHRPHQYISAAGWPQPKGFDRSRRPGWTMSPH